MAKVMRELTRFHYRDPFEIVARREEQRQRQADQSKEARQERAKRDLEKLFEGKSNEQK